MILSIDDFLSAAYKREIIEARQLTTDEIVEMTQLLSLADMEARLKALKDIPAARCHVSMHHRDFLKRAIATRH